MAVIPGGPAVGRIILAEFRLDNLSTSVTIGDTMSDPKYPYFTVIMPVQTPWDYSDSGVMHTKRRGEIVLNERTVSVSRSMNINSDGLSDWFYERGYNLRVIPGMITRAENLINRANKLAAEQSTSRENQTHINLGES